MGVQDDDDDDGPDDYHLGDGQGGFEVEMVWGGWPAQKDGR